MSDNIFFNMRFKYILILFKLSDDKMEGIWFEKHLETRYLFDALIAYVCILCSLIRLSFLVILIHLFLLCVLRVQWSLQLDTTCLVRLVLGNATKYLVLLFSKSFRLLRFQNHRHRNTRSALNKTKANLVELRLGKMPSHCKKSSLFARMRIYHQFKQPYQLQYQTVKFEIKSYSDLEKSGFSSLPSLSSQIFKRFVKSTVQEEAGRRQKKYFTVFSLTEKQNENLSGSVGELLEQLGVKTAMKSFRVGKLENDIRKRSVKQNNSYKYCNLLQMKRFLLQR